MSSILIKNITLDGVQKDILIKGNRIDTISEEIDFKANKVISGHKKVAFPGFVNAHTHAAMTLLRSFSEDLPLKQWLQAIWREEASLDQEMIYWGTKLACLEMIKSGTTTFNDQYWHVESAQKAVDEMGLRSLLSFVILDNFDDKKAAILREECEKAFEHSLKWSDRINFAVSLHSPYTVSESMLAWGGEFARDHNVRLHVHLSETDTENFEIEQKYGLSPTQYLQRLGLLGDNLIAAHSLWLSEKDIEILGDNRVNVVHNINSNLKLASGYKFKYNELRDSGATVCLGTDGCASSNNLDILEAMKTAALLQKAWRRDPAAMPIDELIDVATLNGAKALGFEAGKISEGSLADLLLIDINSPAFIPNHNFKANLIFAANSSSVDTLICNGKVLMESRKVKDEDIIMGEVERLVKRRM